MLGEKVGCTTVSPHLCMLSYRVQCYLPLQQLHSIFRDFNDGVCYVMKIPRSECNPDKELKTTTKI